MQWHVESSGNGLELRRAIEPLGPDLIRMGQHYSVRRRYLGFLVTGPQWIWSVVHVLRGETRFIAKGGRVHPPSTRFCLFVPPYSVVRFDWSQCEVDSDGVLSSAPLG